MSGAALEAANSLKRERYAQALALYEELIAEMAKDPHSFQSRLVTAYLLRGWTYFNLAQFEDKRDRIAAFKHYGKARLDYEWVIENATRTDELASGQFQLILPPRSVDKQWCHVTCGLSVFVMDALTTATTF